MVSMSLLWIAMSFATALKVGLPVSFFYSGFWKLSPSLNSSGLEVAMVSLLVAYEVCYSWSPLLSLCTQSIVSSSSNDFNFSSCLCSAGTLTLPGVVEKLYSILSNLTMISFTLFSSSFAPLYYSWLIFLVRSLSGSLTQWSVSCISKESDSK